MNSVTLNLVQCRKQHARENQTANNLLCQWGSTQPNLSQPGLPAGEYSVIPTSTPCLPAQYRHEASMFTVPLACLQPIDCLFCSSFEIGRFQLAPSYFMGVLYRI